jgi:hypothetical protein
MAVPYKIPDLASATLPLAGTEIVEVVQGGVNKKTTVDDLLDAASGGAGFVTTTDIRLSDARAPTGAAGGDLGGTYPNPTVAKVAGVAPGALGLALLDDTTAAAARTTLGVDTPADSRTPTGAAGGDLTGTYPNPTVAADAITNAKLANMATSTIKGRSTASTGDPEDLTGAQVNVILPAFAGAAKGLVPAASGSPSATKVLNELGAWITPVGGSFDLVSTLTNAEVAITTTATATANRVHKISGTAANYTITLPPAGASGAGALLAFRVAPWASANKVYTLDGNAAETIDGAATLALVHTNSIILISDGSNWFSVSKNLDAPTVDAGVVLVDGTVSAPTIGTTTANRVLLRRIGDSARLRYEVRQTVAGLGGSGEYLYRLPLGLSFASSVTLYTGAGPGSPVDYVNQGRAVCGMVSDGTTALFAWAVPYDATRFRIMGLTWNAGSGHVQSSVAISWAGAADMALGIEFDAQVSGW